MLSCEYTHRDIKPGLCLEISILVPIIAAVILSASSGKFSVNYVDALFLCISGMTSTGLSTVDLSTLTPWQQVILLFVSLVGSPVCPIIFLVVSLVSYRLSLAGLRFSDNRLPAQTILHKAS